MNMATPQFSYNAKPMDYATAQKQAAAQIDPLYSRALQNVNTQKYQNDVQSGQLAASRGLAHSGLAADLINKNGISAQGQVGDISAQRATQLAQMAYDMVNQDKQFNLQNRSQLYNEWMGQQDLQRQDRSWNEMSPAEKARMALQYEYSKKSSGGRGGGRSGTSTGKGTISGTTSSINSLNNALTAFNNAKTPPSAPIDRYYSNPVIQQAQSTGSKYFSNPTPPAKSPYLTDWEKMKMLGL
jgi:hypothetical protein